MKMRMERTDEQGNPVARLDGEGNETPLPEAPPDPQPTPPAAPPEEAAPEPDQPHIGYLLHRAQLLHEKTVSLVGTLLGMQVVADWPLAKRAEDAMETVTALVQTLRGMQVAGVEVKSTPKSRALAKLRPGLSVEFTEKAGEVVAACYKGASLFVGSVQGDLVLVVYGDGRPAGAFRYSEVRPTT